LELFKIKYLGKGGGGEQVVNLSKLLTLGLWDSWFKLSLQLH
jgi:hypothetical protein